MLSKILVFIIYVSFVKHLVLRDTGDELVWHCCLCCCCEIGTGRLLSTTIMIGWCVCSQRECLEKSTSIWEIKGSLFRSVIFAFCVTILMANQQFEKYFFSCELFARKKCIRCVKAFKHSHSFYTRRLKFGMVVKCVCVCLCVRERVSVCESEWRCVCVHVNWLKGSKAMGVAYCKNVHNFQMDSQTYDLVGRLVMSQRTAN